MIDSLVKNPASLSPGTDGINGRVPVLINNRSAVSNRVVPSSVATSGVAELQYESLWDWNILKFEVVDQQFN
jgi:hypothetical protein